MCHHVVWLCCEPQFQFSRCFQSSIKPCGDQGRMWGRGRGEEGQVLGQDMMTLLFSLSSSRNYSHRPLKPPAPEIKLSVIIWFWFLFGGRAADICIHNIVIDGSRWTQRMPLSFVSSFMIGGLNRSLTGGTFLRKSLFKFYCQEIFLWRWAAGWPEHYLGRLFPWSTNENPVSRSRDHSWPIRGRLCPGLLIVPSSSSAIIQHLPIMSHFVILKQVLILLSTFHCNLSSAVSI